MKFFVLIILNFAIAFQLFAQDKINQVKFAIKNLEQIPAMKHGTVAMTIIDAQTGKKLLDYNGEKGMAPASTQKIITSILAYETLGRDFVFKTSFSFLPNGSLFINSSGDPTLGSDRFAQTKKDRTKIITTLQNELTNSNEQISINIGTHFLPYEKVNEGWIWQDLGNYYGAGALPLNWRENKFDIFLNSDNSSTTVQKTEPNFIANILAFQNNSITNAQTTNDNTIITYDFEYEKKININGSIPQNKNNFKVSASYNYDNYLMSEILQKNYNESSGLKINYTSPISIDTVPFLEVQSPPLDSIQYYFLHESINLYGEAFLKTIAAKKHESGSYENGIKAIHQFCKKLNIDTGAVHTFDGCGLSPQNRVTTNALSSFMQYAKKQNWYNSFYNALPIINNTKMKSGSIHQSRAYTGYLKSTNGKEYTFAIIVNGYEGKGKPIQQELWKIIDYLK